MSIEYIQVKDNTKKSDICYYILKSLPLWFGIPESNNEYCQNVKKHDFYKIGENEKPIGFISLKENNEYVSEIYVMGILPEYHRKGIGKNLIDFASVLAKTNNKSYLEVKTLAADRESEEYRRTRLFYTKTGFIPIDVLYNEWGLDNPCLIMLKPLL